MKKLFILTAIVVMTANTLFGQCTSLFSFAAYFETVTFINQSSVSNAHYFWNFGDGTGSNFETPTHKFPETGTYLVTLFAKDTISNCSSYYEYWVSVSKYSTDTCQPSITDSVFFYSPDYFLKVINLSNNCNGYDNDIDGGPAQNFSPGNWIWLGGGWHHGRFVSRIQFYTYDTITGYVVHREAYKSSPFLYTSSKNYGDCSANFEFKVVSQDTSGQRILFTAMNKTATYYEWEIIGFGNGIVTNNDTISKYYPYNYNNLWIVGLKTTGSSGCNDTLYQNIIVQPNNQTLASVTELQNNTNYNLYPNPFYDKAVLDFPNIKQKTTFTLFNTNGQAVRTINNITGGQVTIERENLASGLYFFILKTENKIIATGKLVTE
jgi:hypothetical protein